jgi:uncharacterized protein involved in response to NO
MAVFTPAEPQTRPAPRGFALFALGFRPLYLFAGAYAALSVPIWALQFAGMLPGANMLWHAHEMLFGYAFAVIAGFLLTAVRVWTQRPTPTGAFLAGIALLWLLARITAFESLFVSSLLDLLFAIGVAVGIGKPILESRNRNWFFILLVLGLGVASIAFQAYPQVALAVGLDIVLVVVAIMGGRVIPPFTNNGAPGARARRIDWLEKASIAAVVLILVLDVLVINPWPVAFVAAALHAWRMALWSPMATLRRPILWILHLSYAWIVVHLALRGFAGLGLVAPGLATHALTVGVIGGLTLGMMTRTSRGHTARPLKVGGWETAAYVLVHLAALIRVFTPVLIPEGYSAFIVLSGVLWSAAFAIFTVVYIPILTRPRLDGQPG